MGRLYFHSTEAVWEMVAREEWLGCRHAVAHVGHTQVNTSVGSTFYFWVFHSIKLICTMFSKQNKTKTLVVSDLVLTRRGSENVFRPPIGFKYILNTTDDFQVF